MRRPGVSVRCFAVHRLQRLQEVIEQTIDRATDEARAHALNQLVSTLDRDAREAALVRDLLVQDLTASSTRAFLRSGLENCSLRLAIRDPYYHWSVAA